MDTFPSIAAPVIPNATNSGDTYKGTESDSTIVSQSDANYKKTRARATRMIQTRTYVWTHLSDADFATLKSFWELVGTAVSFSFTDFMDGNVYEMRFSDKFAWRYNPPYGYIVSLAFEEV